MALGTRAGGRGIRLGQVQTAQETFAAEQQTARETVQVRFFSGRLRSGRAVGSQQVQSFNPQGLQPGCSRGVGSDPKVGRPLAFKKKAKVALPQGYGWTI